MLERSVLEQYDSRLLLVHKAADTNVVSMEFEWLITLRAEVKIAWKLQ